MHQRSVTTEFSMERVVPFFQPIIDLSSNKVWRYECLARLVTESEHIFLPSEFLYIVDREKANTELTHHIYALGHQYFAQHKMPWSINLSSADLADVNMINWLMHECNQQQECLFGLEISFSDAVEYKDVIAKLISGCKKISISIDDIEGVSADLTSLLEVGVEALKIRGSFANEIGISADSKSRLSALVKLCKQYQTKLVAEHIEDKDTLTQLSNVGVKYGQGFYFSQPSAAPII